MFELAKTPVNKEKNELLDSLHLVLKGARNSIHTEICENANEKLIIKLFFCFI